MAHLGAAAKRALHYRAAQALRQAVDSSNTPLLLWDSAEHWLQAGEHPTAVSEMQKCAALALNLGSPSEAVRMINRALELCGNRPYRASIVEQRVEILRRGGLWSDLVSAVEELNVLDPVSTSNERHWDRKLTLLEARRRSGLDPAQLLPEAMECVVAAQSATHRILAAALIFKLCDNTLLAVPAHRAFAVVEPLLASTEAPALVRLEAEMIYHCGFGDLDRVPRVARELVEAARATAELSSLSQMLGYAALALRLSGNLDEARQFALEAYELAAASGIAPLAAPPAEILAVLARLTGDAEGVKKWTSESVVWARRSQTGFGGPGMLQEAAFQAIVQQDYLEAERLLCESDRYSTVRAYRRSQLAQLSFAHLLRLESRAELPSETELKQLTELLRDAQGFTIEDSVPYAISKLLRATGQRLAARQVLFDYVGKHRRSRAPLQWELANEMARYEGEGEPASSAVTAALCGCVGGSS